MLMSPIFSLLSTGRFSIFNLLEALLLSMKSCFDTLSLSDGLFIISKLLF